MEFGRFEALYPNPFGSTPIAAHDFDGRFGHVQPLCEDRANRFVRLTIDRRSAYPNLHRAVWLGFDFLLSAARDDADVELCAQEVVSEGDVASTTISSITIGPVDSS